MESLDTGLGQIIRNYKDNKHIAFKKNDFLFRENEEAKGIYCIESGSVKIFKKDHTGTERILYLATSEEILGLHAVVNSHPYTTSAAAISDTTTVFIAHEDFMTFLKSSNTYRLLVMKGLCSRIDYMEEHIIGISEKMSQERFADTLLMLIDKYGISNKNTLNIQLTVDELASYTCTSKSYMKKIVSEFSTRGLVSISANTIKILNLTKLKEYCKSGINSL